MTAAPDAPRAQQERSRRTHRVLLDAGLALLAEEGPEALTIAAVSAAAGVAPGTVYRRFGDKEGLLAQLQQEFTDGFRDEFAQRMDRAALGDDVDARTAVAVAVRALADTFRAHEPLLRVFVVLGLRDPQVLRVGSSASQEGGQLFRALLWPHRRAFTGGDPERAIDIAHRLTYAACTHRVLHGANLESATDVGWDEWTTELDRAVALYLLADVGG